MIQKQAKSWPVLLLALPAFVAIWSGWVDLGRLTGFGVVHPLPGIWDEAQLNTAITLPIGLETYAAFALYVWLAGAGPARAREFAKRSAIGSLALGAGGQVAYHLMVAAGMTKAPWWITTLVACLPVAVLGMGAALAHLIRDVDPEPEVSTTTSDTSLGELVDTVDQDDEGPASDPWSYSVPVVQPPVQVDIPKPVQVDKPKVDKRPPTRQVDNSRSRVEKAHLDNPLATNEQLAMVLGVSTKTVQRYRPAKQINGHVPELEGVTK